MKMKNYFGKKKLLGCGTANPLLNSVFFLFQWKNFRIKGREHRNLSSNNFELGPNFIKFSRRFA